MRFVVILVSLGIALLGAEALVRLVGPVDFETPRSAVEPDLWKNLIHQPSTVEGLAYEIAPNPAGSAVRDREGINRLGFRGPAPQTTRPAGARRMAILGDSFTYGLGVSASETYPALLERLLDEMPRSPGWEVLNLGVTAYSAREEAIALEAKAMPLEPDLIVVGYVLNDPEMRGGSPLRHFYDEPRWWQRSHLCRLAAKAERAWDVRRLGGGDYIRFLHAHPASWRGVEHAFERMARAGRDAGVPVVIVLLPLIPEESWGDYAYLDIHRQVAAAATERGLPVLDLRAALATHSPAELRLSTEDWHPTPFGYRVVARALLEALVAEGLVP